MARTLFISYSRADMQDTLWLDRLRMYLAPLRRGEITDVWDDSRIGVGTDWREGINEAIDRANAAVLLIGPGFLASEFVMTEELPRLLHAAEKRGTRIFPLIIGYSFYRNSMLGRYQAFNDPDKPLESLERAEQNKILNSLAFAIDQAMRETATEIPHPGPTTVDLCRVMGEVKRNLEDTFTAFDAQARRRDALVGAMYDRLNIKDTLEYEKFFFRYYGQMTPDERFEFEQIRAITDGPLYLGNKKIMQLLDSTPILLEEIPALAALRQHLVFWLNKYERVFTRNQAMCLLYTGVEDGVPFPSGVDRAVADWLKRCDRG